MDCHAALSRRQAKGAHISRAGLFVALVCLEKMFGPFLWLLRGPHFGHILCVLALEISSEIGGLCHANCWLCANFPTWEPPTTERQTCAKVENTNHRCISNNPYPLAKGVAVHPLNKGCGSPKQHCKTSGFGPSTPPMKGVNL